MRGPSIALRALSRCLVLGSVAWLAAGCNNNPWKDDAAASNTLFSAVQESSPRHLDPTASYWNNDTAYTYQIYEPLYGYHYLKRPFQLVPKCGRGRQAPLRGQERPAAARRRARRTGGREHL